MSIWILENSDGEKAVVANMVGFRKVMRLDPVAKRFEESKVVGQIPTLREVGTNAAIRIAIEAVGAVYPAPNSRTLKVVDNSGNLLVGPACKIGLARGTGTARRTIMDALTTQRKIAAHGGWVVHS